MRLNAPNPARPNLAQAICRNMGFSAEGAGRHVKGLARNSCRLIAAPHFETVRQAGAHTAHTCTAQAFKRLRRHDLDQIAVPIDIY